MTAPRPHCRASTSLRRNGGMRRFLERVITRDVRVPLSDDDREMEHSWRCIPVPPSDDPNWFVLDSSRGYKTVWGRWHESGGHA
jgi:hypothetical protein